jgi:hypothetical protein
VFGHTIENEEAIVDWLLLDSSVFAAAAYRPAKHMLYLLFRSGELYCYFDFPPEQYRDFLAADSKGQYFSSNIRDRFRYQRLPRPGRKRR